MTVTSKDQFLKFRQDAMNIKADMDEARGQLGSLFKNAEDDIGLHRAAAKLSIKLAGQSEEKRQDFLRAFDAYRDYLDLDEGTEDMFDEAPAVRHELRPAV